MESRTTLSRVQATSAVYDLVVAGVFAFPVLAALYLDVALRAVHGWVGAAGIYPEVQPFHVLFVNMFGGFTIVWSVVRILRSREALLAVSDALLRFYFALLMATYIVLWEVPSILYVFVGSEILWGTVLLGVVARARPIRRGPLAHSAR